MKRMGHKICIICTNDAHCALCFGAHGIGFDGVVAVVAKARRRYGVQNVCLVDSGDALGVGALGCISAGEIPLAVMNRAGYVAACPGNADLTFGPARMLELSCAASFEFVCANLVDLVSSKPVFAPYRLCDVGGLRVAFVGVVTPLAASAFEASAFATHSQSHIWDCSSDNEGRRLYRAVQNAVDDARTHGADIVVLLSHLGQTGEHSAFRSDVVVANTHGIDLVCDGHSHERYCQRVSDLRGHEVVIVQGGLKLACANVVEIDAQSLAIKVTAVDVFSVQPDDTMSRFVDSCIEPWKGSLDKGICALPCFLAAQDEAGSWLVRRQETNLGDLVADAWCDALDADIALVPSWVIRDNLASGQVSMHQLYEVLCLGHNITCVKVSGQVICDALAFAVCAYPKPNRYWLQVSSSLSFAFDASCSTVSDVRIGGKPICAQSVYTVAGVDFMIQAGKGAYGMFAVSQPVDCDAVRDVDALARYLSKLGQEELCRCYANPDGAGRIRVL